MAVAIMQPTYLPWSGYFNLIARTSDFIFLDDVQFSHQSWQQRNRIVVQGKPYVLTVPVHAGENGPQSIHDVRVDDSKNWRKKHVRTIQQTYARHPFGHDVAALVEQVLAADLHLLTEINIGLIAAFCRAMGMEPRLHRSSELQIEGSRSDRLLAMCRHFRADSYLSPRGSREYLEEDAVFDSSEIKVVYQDFEPAAYSQRGSADFVSHMSIVDIAANLGFDEARKYVTSVSVGANANG